MNLWRYFTTNRSERSDATSLQRPVLELLEDRVVPALFLVDSTTDGFDNQGDPEVGTLRWAITEANKTSAWDKIIFAIGQGDYTIELEKFGLPAITAPVTIDAQAPNAPAYTGQTIALTRTILGANAVDPGAAGLVFSFNFNGQEGVFQSSSGSKVIGLAVFGFDGVDNIGREGTGIRIAWQSDIHLDNLKIYRNRIGVNITGYTAHDNSITGSAIGSIAKLVNPVAGDANKRGIVIDSGAFNNVIGASGFTFRNYVTGNEDVGIAINNAHNNTLAGNFIGLEYDESVPAVRQAVGVAITGNSSDNLIGGQAAVDIGMRIETPINVISGSGGTGIQVDVSQATGANRIQGNFIGTNSLGTLSRANGGYGITLDGSSATRVGGANAGLGNVIASNAAILLQGPGLLPGAGIRVSSSDNIIRNNNIGTGRDPGTDLRNTGWGILITPAANRNVVTDNTIKFNTLGGVSADETTNTIRNNKIAANIGIGIDIGLVGLTTDGMPVLTTVIVNGATLTMTVSGSLTSTPNTTFAIDLYGNTAPDPSGYGEGEFFLGTVEVTTDSSGTVYFTAIVDGGYDGFFVTATATDLVEGGTSEFAKNVVAYLPATVQVHVFEDINSNGVQDFEEAYWGMSVVVTLQSTTGGATYIGYVNLAGGVTFEGVVADTYTLTFSLPAGYEFTLQDQGSDDFLDSDVNSAGTTDPFTVLASEFNSSFAAGLLFTPTTPS